MNGEQTDNARRLDMAGGGRGGRPIGRRMLLRTAGIGGVGSALAGVAWAPRVLAQAPPGASPSARAAEVTIDLPTEPPTLDPALAYDPDAWSVVHAVYDALVQYGPDGQLEPLLAASLPALLNPLTYEIRLRPGVVFHNGEPFDGRSVTASVAHLVDPDVNSQVADTFRVIERVEEVDALTVRLHLARPAPWLPAQMAAWLAMLPPEYAADPATDLGANPVGTGPYRFAGWNRGAEIALEANLDSFAASPKGRPIADRVAYRFVPDAGTRVADLLAGASDLVRAVPVDQVEAVESGGARVVVQPLSGSAWVRIPTDVAPFGDVRVRRALNHAVDVDAIVVALLGGEGARLPNFFVPGGLGFDPALAPYAYDPDRSRALLAEAGHADGFETTLEHAATERADVVAAVAGMLEAVGVRAEVRPVETATFNQTWIDPATAPLRFVTWRPLFDPDTLLSLLVSRDGFLSRHDNPTAQPLIEAAAAETDEAARADLYRRLGRVLHDEPAAIYLYGLTARYGLAADVPAWTPRPDDYIIPTARG